MHTSTALQIVLFQLRVAYDFKATVCRRPSHVLSVSLCCRRSLGILLTQAPAAMFTAIIGGKAFFDAIKAEDARKFVTMLLLVSAKEVPIHVHI